MEQHGTNLKIVGTQKGWQVIKLTDMDTQEPVTEIRRAVFDIETAFHEFHPLTSISDLRVYAEAEPGVYRLSKRMRPM